MLGYPYETFLAGARVDRQYGLGPLPRVGMMAILISRAGTCTVAFRYDAASFAAYIAECQLETTMSFNDYYIDTPDLPAWPFDAFKRVVILSAIVFAVAAGLGRGENTCEQQHDRPGGAKAGPQAM